MSRAPIPGGSRVCSACDDFLDLLGFDVELGCDFVGRGAQVAVTVEAADQVLGDRPCLFLEE